MTEPRYRGAIIARNKNSAQVCLDRMSGLLGFPILSVRNWVVFTPWTYLHAGRGCMIPNRILIYDLEKHEIPEDLWHELIPSILPDDESGLNIFYFRRENADA